MESLKPATEYPPPGPLEHTPQVGDQVAPSAEQMVLISDFSDVTENTSVVNLEVRSDPGYRVTGHDALDDLYLVIGDLVAIARRTIVVEDLPDIALVGVNAIEADDGETRKQLMAKRPKRQQAAKPPPEIKRGEVRCATIDKDEFGAVAAIQLPVADVADRMFIHAVVGNDEAIVRPLLRRRGGRERRIVLKPEAAGQLPVPGGEPVMHSFGDIGGPGDVYG
jgi:hypothetical protein